jgi:hypothetical protein
VPAAGTKVKTMTNSSARHFCRNPRCRSKLPAPVENHHHAFCCRGCHAQFYRARCLVCERDIDIDPMTGAKRGLRQSHRKFCGRKCSGESARFPHTYAWKVPAAVKTEARSSNADKTASKSRVESNQPVVTLPRGWWWGDPAEINTSKIDSPINVIGGYRTPRIDWGMLAGDPIVGDLSLYDRDGLTVARIVLEPDGRHHPRAPIVRPPQSWADLDSAKRGAVSFALAGLPLDPKLATRLARDNETPHPMGPPRGERALVETANFKIRESGAGTYLDPGPIPEFLRRVK